MAIFAIVVVMSAAFFPIERTLELRTDIVVGPKTAIMLHVDRAELQRQLRHHAPPSSPPPSSMNDTAPSFSMPDIGFTLTTPLHDYLFAHPDLHDLLALLNTIGVVAMYPYAIFREKSVLDGRPGLVVCGMLMFMLRLVVGCATQLPMHPEYLPSRFDFPDAMYGERVPFQVCRLATERSLAVRCSIRLLTRSGRRSTFTADTAPWWHSLPLLPPRSGTHDWLALRSGLILHRFARARVRDPQPTADNQSSSFAVARVLALLQAIRMLATRGHYSIDIIIGVIIGLAASRWVLRIDALVSHDAAIELRDKLQRELDRVRVMTGDECHSSGAAELSTASPCAADLATVRRQAAVVSTAS